MIGTLLAHSGDIEVVEPLIRVSEGSSFPVFGTVLTASIGLVTTVIFLTLVYYLMGKIPRIKIFKLTTKKEVFLARTIVAFILGALISAGWDIWWHRAVGRDSLFQEPHLFLYGFAILAIIGSVIGWTLTHKKAWKRVATVLILIPATAPFDNLWHILFGVEDLSNPIALAWSPPHMLLDIGGLFALIFLLPILARDKKEVRRDFFLDIVFALMLGQIMFLALPFHPTEGWGQVSGFWGAGVMMMVFTGVLTYAKTLLKENFDITRIVIYYLLILLVGYGEETASNIILIPHDRQAVWLVIIPYLLAAVFLDLSNKKLPDYLRGAIAGGIWAAVLFFPTPFFAEPGFGYPLINALNATVSGLIGGAVGVILVKKIFKLR